VAVVVVFVAGLGEDGTWSDPWTWLTVLAAALVAKLAIAGRRRFDARRMERSDRS
jgi:hypothetical protein